MVVSLAFLGLLQTYPFVPRPSGSDLAALVAQGAVRQTVAPARYDASYVRIAFPGGDVPPDRGACTDVVVRAFRWAGIDLQELTQREHRRRPLPRVTRPEPSIDHRRCPNLLAVFERNGRSLSPSSDSPDWQPGDVVFWKLPNGLDHVGIVVAREGRPWVVHNIAGVACEDALGRWRIVGHFRYTQD